MNFSVHSRFGALELEKAAIDQQRVSIPGTLDNPKYDRYTLQFYLSPINTDHRKFQADVFQAVKPAKKTEIETDEPKKKNKKQPMKIETPTFNYSFRLTSEGEIGSHHQDINVRMPSRSGSLKIAAVLEQIQEDVKNISWQDVEQTLKNLKISKQASGS